MIKGKDLFPRELVIEAEFLVKEASCHILVICRDLHCANAQLRVILVGLKFLERRNYNSLFILLDLKLIDEYFALEIGVPNDQ